MWLEDKQANKRARSAAWNASINNLISVNNILDKFGWTDEIAQVGPSIHSTHGINKVGTQNAIFCTRCSAWAAGKSYNKFALACTGSIPSTSAFQHRLRCCGVIPTPGARIPQHLRKISNRKRG